MDIKLIGILNDSASGRPFFNGLPVLGEVYEGHLCNDTKNSWLIRIDDETPINANWRNCYIRYPLEFFMPLAEWRNKQIETILEE